jgi:hypothetical protein
MATWGWGMAQYGHMVMVNETSMATRSWGMGPVWQHGGEEWA